MKDSVLVLEESFEFSVKALQKASVSNLNLFKFVNLNC